MNVVLITLMLLLNFGISWFNAYTVGRSWAETKQIGGWSRFMAWCGAVMSACGFTWCVLIIVVMAAVGFGWLPVAGAVVAMELGYAIIILPILGSGLAIWAESLVVAWKRRDTASIGAAAWNTFAQGYNTYSAVSTLPGVLSHLGDFFSGDLDIEDLPVMIIVALVAFSLGGGILLTAAIVRVTARRRSGRSLSREERV